MPTATTPRRHPEPTGSPPPARVASALRRRIVAEGLPELLRVDDAARLVDVHRSTMWSWISEGLPRIRVGRCTRVPASELIDWLSRRVEVAG